MTPKEYLTINAEIVAEEIADILDDIRKITRQYNHDDGEYGSYGDKQKLATYYGTMKRLRTVLNNETDQPMSDECPDFARIMDRAQEIVEPKKGGGESTNDNRSK
jgi:hypothetical protein